MDLDLFIVADDKSIYYYDIENNLTKLVIDQLDRDEYLISIFQKWDSKIVALTNKNNICYFSMGYKTGITPTGVCKINLIFKETEIFNKDNYPIMISNAMHSAILTNNQKCYVFGSNKEGELGLGFNCDYKIKNLMNFTLPNENINFITCGTNHTTILTDAKKCYVFGNNKYGYLGLGHRDSVNIPMELKILSLEKDDYVISAASGNCYTLLITKKREVYGFGGNEYGQLGLGYNGFVETPECMDLSFLCETEYFVTFVCGKDHTIGLTNKKKTYVFGYNKYGQLGLGHNRNINIPKELKILDEYVVSIDCNVYYTVVLTEKSKIYFFGNKSNYVGVDCINYPKEIILPFKPIKLRNQIKRSFYFIKRLLWIAKLKDDKTIFNKLPHDIINYIILMI